MTNYHLANFGWVVRYGVVTFAKSADIVAYVEMDGASNRGGHVRMVLTTGEVIDIEAHAVPYKAGMQFQKGIACVDQLCEVTCSPGNLKGMCSFETTANIQAGTKRPEKMTNCVTENKFHPV